MNFEQYRERFGQAIQDQLRAIDASMQTFNQLLRDVDAGFHEARENDAELKRLILEQGEQMREQRDQISLLQQQINRLGGQL